MSDRSGMMPSMNKLSRADRVRVLTALAEGCSVSAAVRMTDVSKPTVLKLLVDAGEVCAEAHNRLVVHVNSRRVQADEIWSFVGAKKKNATDAQKECGMGDSWLWLGIDADTKLIVSYLVGMRDAECAESFIADLASRLARRVQLTTDGLAVYLDAVDKAFGDDVDFAQLVKEYKDVIEEQRRYSPAKCCGAKKTPVTGSPDPEEISTSYSERLNLTIRTHNKRFVRLTIAFSKKLANHIASTQLHVFYYNFARVHRTVRKTPAMAAGLTDRRWTMEDVVKLLEEKEAREAAALAPKSTGLRPLRQPIRMG